MSAAGLLLVLADISASEEEEFNAWYDTEHLPERAAIPGVLSARRYVSTGDGPHYAASYDLASVSVLASPEYLAVSGPNFSPWTRRVTARSRTIRMVGELAAQQDLRRSAAARLMVLRCDCTGPSPEAEARALLPAMEDGLRASFAASPALLRWRLYRGLEPQPNFLLALVELSGSDLPPLELDAFGPAGAQLGLAASYRGYAGSPWPG